MADLSDAPYVGWSIPDLRATVWAAETASGTDYTEAGPLAGVPEPQQSTGLTVQAVGTQTAASEIEIRTQRGGIPRPQDGAAFTWKNAADADTDWRGWEPPQTISRFEYVVQTDATGDYKYAATPHAITLADHTVLVVYEDRDDAQAGPYRVRVGIRSGGSSPSWSHVTVQAEANAPSAGNGNYDYHPCLCLLPSGRVLCFFWANDSVATEAQVRMYFSDDDGATWSLGAKSTLDTPVSTAAGTGYTLGRIRAAYGNGQILMLCEVVSNNAGLTFRQGTIQNASRDEGAYFEQVEVFDNANEGHGAQDIVFTRGRFVVAYHDVSTEDLYVRILGSAYASFDAASATDLSSHTGTTTANKDAATGKYFDTAITGDPEAETALCEDDDGTLYVYVSVNGTGSSALLLRSLDGGVSWGPMNVSPSFTAGEWFAHEGAEATHPRGYTATKCEGRVVILTQHYTPNGNEDPSLSALYLGGYSTVTLPGYGARGWKASTRVNWLFTYIPWDLPSAVQWTTTGTATEAIVDPGGSAGYYQISDTNLTGYHTRTLTAGSNNEGLTVEFHVACTVGGDITDDRVSINLVLDSGTVDYDISIRFSATQFRIYDNNAAAYVAAATTVAMATGIQLRIGLGGAGLLATWYRLNPNTYGDREWTAGPTSAGLTDGGGGGGGIAHKIEWGHRVATGTNTSRWWFVGYTYDASNGAGLHNGQTNPDDLFGRPYSLTPTYVDDGVRVSARSGPTILADEFHVATRYTYALTRALYSGTQHSPRLAWRSTSTAQQQIALQWSDDIGDALIGNDLMFVGLYNSNVSQVQVHLYDKGTTSWISIGTVNAYDTLTGLQYTRFGNTVRPKTTGTSTNEPYLYFDEYKGGYFWFDASDSRVISGHSEGKWEGDNASPIKLPELLLAGCDNTEAASGTDGRIIPKDWGFFVHLEGTQYSGIRLTIPAPTAAIPAPPESYWRIGYLHVGPVVVHPSRWSHGHENKTEAATEVRESRDLIVRAKNVAPARRTMTGAWADIYDASNAQSLTGNPSPGYRTASADASARAVAADADHAWQLEGMLRRVNGPQYPVVCLNHIPSTSAAAPLVVLNRRWTHMLCRFMRPVTITNVKGDEGSTELLRIGTFEAIEEV